MHSAAAVTLERGVAVVSWASEDPKPTTSIKLYQEAIKVSAKFRDVRSVTATRVFAITRAFAIATVATVVAIAYDLVVRGLSAIVSLISFTRYSMANLVLPNYAIVRPSAVAIAG